jgi:hypothetical protein
MSTSKQRHSGLKEWIIEWFGRAEDVIYVGLGVLLAAIALTLLVTEVLYFGRYISSGTLAENIVFLLDRILLIIIFVEVLYTVQVSFNRNRFWSSA